MAEITVRTPPTGGQKAWALLFSSLLLGLGAWLALGWSYYCLLGAIPIGVGFLAGIFSPESSVKATVSAFVVTLALPSLLRSEAAVCAVFLVPLLWLSSFVGSVLRRHLRARRHDARQDASEDVWSLRHD